MRFLIACLAVAAVSAALPQSSNEFHSRYGEPDLLSVSKRAPELVLLLSTAQTILPAR